MTVYLFAFLTVGCALIGAALMTRIGYGGRTVEATLAGAIPGLVLLFAVPSVPAAALPVAFLLSMGASLIFHKRR